MPKKQKPITDEIATVEKDIFQDYIGKTLLNPDKVLRSESGGKGIELYEGLLIDDKVGSTLQTRKLAVVGKEWEVIPGSDKRQDQKIADFVKQVLLNFCFDDARKVLLSGVVLGFKPGEIMWEYSEGDIWIKEIIGKASRRFVFDTSRKMRLITLQNMIDGEELPDKKFLVYTNTSDNGSPYGDGLGRQLYWPVWFKKNAIKFWMIFADKFGSPTVVGKYPPGTLKPQQDALLDAIDAIQQGAAVKIPDNMVIELLEATRGGSINTYDGLCNFMNGAIAQVMLGQTLTSDVGDKGSYAASKTHEDVRQDYIKADADSLCAALNRQLVRWVVDYNFPGVTVYPEVWIRTEMEKDLKPLAARDKIIIVDMGVPVTKKYVYDTYGIPEPQEGEELIEPKTTPPALPPGFREKYAKKHISFSQIDPASTDWITIYMKKLAPSLRNARLSALDEVEAYLKSLSSPPTQNILQAKVAEILGAAYSVTNRKAVSDIVTEMYRQFRGEPGAALGFGGPDIRSIKFLSNLDSFYISKFVNNPDMQKAVQDFINERYLEDSAGLFGRGTPGDFQAFRDLFAQKLADLEDWQVRRIIDTSVARVQNWATVSQLHEAGIAEIVIYEPTQDCDFCQEMNGRVIQTETAHTTMMAQAGMTPEEYEQELKSFPPVVDNIDALIARGQLPPYHPHCHGIVIRRVE